MAVLIPLIVYIIGRFDTTDRADIIGRFDTTDRVNISGRFDTTDRVDTIGRFDTIVPGIIVIFLI